MQHYREKVDTLNQDNDFHCPHCNFPSKSPHRSVATFVTHTQMQDSVHTCHICVVLFSLFALKTCGWWLEGDLSLKSRCLFCLCTLTVSSVSCVAPSGTWGHLSCLSSCWRDAICERSEAKSFQQQAVKTEKHRTAPCIPLHVQGWPCQSLTGVQRSKVHRLLPSVSTRRSWSSHTVAAAL